VSAAVRVPRSYFIASYKNSHNGTDPDQTALDLLEKDELGHILQDVKNCTGITDDNKVTVNWYADGAASAPRGPVTVEASPVATLLESHMRDIAVAGLAGFSLFMVMMMVRKSSPTPLPLAIAAAAEKGPPRLKPETSIAGEVGESERTMEGMELDEEAVKTQQVVEQVSSMVSENPDAAANLVKRWLSRT
jgi:flagellar biosynthesis/type III secretory pathway M-ring protein FliF/YscJ